MRDGFKHDSKKRLGVLLVLLAVLPTLAVGFVGYNFMFEYLRADRMKDVGLAAEAKHNQLAMVLTRESNRAESLLLHLSSRCGAAAAGPNQACAANLIRAYLTSENALGATLFGDAGANITAGASAVGNINDLHFRRGQLGRLAGPENRTYFVAAADPSAGLKLAITYRASNLQSVFGASSELGDSGETLFADAEGNFVTKARYPSVQGHEQQASAGPMRACLSGKSGESIVNGPRGAGIIQGYRPVRELGSGCILAQVDQVEAFAPLVALERKAAGIFLIFLLPVVLAALYVARRITKSEQSLRAGESKLRMLFESANDSLMLLDPQGRILDVNQTGHERLGYAKAEMVGNNIAQFVPPASAARVPGRFAEIAEKGHVIFEALHLRRDGSETPIEVNARVVELDGRQQIFSIVRDLTERKEVQEQFELMIRTSLDGFWILDEHGRIQEVNDAYLRLTGYSHEELRSRASTYVDVAVNPDDTARHIRQAMAGGSVVFETRHRAKDGRILDIEVSAKHTPKYGGRIYCFLRDITERKQAEHALRASENKFHVLFESASDCLVVLDPQGIILDINRTGHELLGYAKEELVGQSIARFAAPDIAAGVPRRLDLLGARGHGFFESALVCGDGSRIAVEVNANVIALEGTQKIFSVIRNISERKEVEQQFKLLVDASLDGFWFTDMRGNFLEVNDGYCELTGYRREELLGMSILDVEVNEKPEDTARHIEYLMQHGSDRFETRHRARDGSILDMEIGVTYTPKYGGRLYCFLRDISGRKRAENALRTSQQHLQLFIEWAPVGIAMLDMDMRYIAASRCFFEKYGVTDTASIGRSHYEIFPDIPERWRAMHRRCLAGETMRCDEDRFQRADGRVHWIRWEIRPWFATPGKIGGIVLFSEDIGERKQTEKSLRESAQLLQAHMENSPLALVAWDDSYCVTQWSGEAEKMFGWSAAETLGKPIMDLHMIYEEDIPVVQQAMARLADGESRYVVSANRNVTRDGRVIDCVWYNTVLAKDDGAMASIMSQVLDVTEKNRAERLLQQERLHLEEEVQRRTAALTKANATLEALFREADDLYQHAPCGYHSVDRNGTVVRMNDTELNMLGYTREEVIGRKVQELLTPGGQAVFAESFVRFKEQGYMRGLEVEYRRKDGRPLHTMINTSAVRDDNGEFVMSRATVFDMSERKQAAQAELRLNRALKLLSVGNSALVRAQDEQSLLSSICRLVVEVGGYLMAWVGYAEYDADKTVRPVALSGYEEGYLSNMRISWADCEMGRGTSGTAVRTGITQVSQNIHTNPAMRPWREAALRRGYQSNISLPIVCLGSTLGVLTIYAVEPEAFVSDEIALLEELTSNLAYGIEALRVRAMKAEAEQELELHRRSLEDLVALRTAELSAAKLVAEHANNAKSRFLAAASHDLRQPLSALKLYVSLLKRKLPEEHSLLMNMEGCVGGLSNLLSKLLDLSKLEAGVVTPQVGDFAVFDVISQVCAAHAPEADAKSLTLRCRYSGLAGRTDPVLFQRIVGNLVSNAVQYTERGGVLIGVRRREGRWWVEVWDTGIGIPADKTAEIFEEFKQLGDDARTHGSGLGLTIVAKTASLLGLQIRVRSRVNRGSLFAVELPLGEQAPVAQRPAFDLRTQGARVAVVDDNAVVLHALALMLEASGNEVFAAATAEAVLAALAGAVPDIVVSDYRLAAGQTGFDVIDSLRAAYGADLPGVILTGDIDPKLISSMTGKGIAILHKPVELDELLARIEEAKNGASVQPGSKQATLTYGGAP